MTDPLKPTVVDLFDDWATKTPEATAVEWDGQSLTYSGLREASLHVSKTLLSVGAGSGDMIPILSQMSLELVPTILGVLRVGACYVSIDMEVWSKERIESVLKDISPKVAITTSQLPDIRHVPVIIAFQERWLQVPFDGTDETCNRLDEIRKSLDTKALVYITFTSGTTGRPKGVMIYHHALHQFAVLISGGIHDTTPGQRVMLAFSISFDVCAAVIWSTITRGKSLVMASSSTFPEVATTCDSVILTPSMLNTMEPTGPYEKVRSIYLGAEAVNFDVARQWISPTREVIHTYGPSEATINISYGKIPAVGGEGDLGVFNPGVEVYLVDKDMKECDYGEILIGGPCLAAGYLNNPELTAEKFIDWNGKRVYRTSDLARRTKNGLSWGGRVDHMVKNRGFSVNLETDVEANVLRFTGIQAAAALMWRGKLMAFVQPGTVNLEALRVFMKEHFDHFVVPDETLALDQLPLTAHGKVDRKALHARLENRMTEEDAELDAKVCISAYDSLQWAYAKCLQVPLRDLDRTSSFSRLGGNSLASIRLSKLLRQQGYTIPIVQILRGDTIGNLEERLTPTHQQNATNGTSVKALGKSEAVPATDLHRVMLEQSQVKPVTNCLLMRGKWVGPQDSVPTSSQLRTAWTAALAAHSIFKTRYDLQSWTLHDMDHINLDWEEIKVEPEEFDTVLLSVDEKIWAQQNSLKNLPSSSLEVPYCHLTCVYASNQKSIGFVWRIHHALVDMFSFIILFRDLEKALAKEELAPGPRIQDYALFFQKFKNDKLTTATKFWGSMMRPMFEQPIFDFKSPQTPFEGNLWQSLTFTTSETGGSIEALVHTYNISSATLIFAAWALTLAKYTRSSYAAFVLSRSGRLLPWEQAPDLVGAMNCRVPFATSIPAEATVVEWLQEMHSILLSVAELENLSQSLDKSVYPPDSMTTGVQAFLDINPHSSPFWDVHDGLTGEAGILGMVWIVQQTATGAVEADLKFDPRRVDIEWAREVGTVGVGILEGLTNVQGSTKLRSLGL